MHPHPYLLAALTEDRSRQCPCGAVAERRHGLCRKCYARVQWRRKTTHTAHRTSRHLAARQARAGARRFTDAMSFVTKRSKGVES
jgi:hypothetical protein